MPLIKKRIWSPEGEEISVMNHLEEIYRDEEHDVYLFHNVLVGALKEDEKPIKPDFIILDPNRGIAIVEVKSWKVFELEGNSVIFNNTNDRDLNPIIKGQNYFFNLAAILKNRKVKLDKEHFKSHLVFTKLDYDSQLEGDFVTSHFLDFKKTLTLENLFSVNKKIPLDIISQIRQVIDPVITFYKKPKELDEKICDLDKLQSEIVCRNPFGHYLISGIPGSGKSIMIASRAIFLKEMYPDWEILILSVNRKLVTKIDKDIKQRLSGREGVSSSKNIECNTLKEFLISCCPPKDKIDFQKIGNYTDQIQFLRDKASPTIKWDAILVDEYQDLTDEDFSIILKCCKKHKALINKEERLVENLFLSGDKLQQIWENGCSHSWEKIGVHIKGRGRSTVLKTSYRSPSDITTVALEYLIHSGLENEVKQFYEGVEDIEHLYTNEDCLSFDIGWDQDGVGIHSRIRQTILNGISPSDILLIVPPGKLFSFMKSIFKNEIENGMVLGTHHEIKGLEAPYVFIFNLGSFDFILSKTPKVQARIIYMCITRSNHFVHITSFKDEGSISLIKEIDSKVKKMKKVA